MSGNQDQFETLVVPPADPLSVPPTSVTFYVPPDEYRIAIQGDNNAIVIGD